MPPPGQYPPSSGGWATPPQQPPGNRTLVPVLLGVVAALAIIVGVVVVVNGGGGDDPEPVTLERIDYSPANGFFDNVDLALQETPSAPDDLGAQLANLDAWEGLETATDDGASLAGVGTSGDAPGLYGGSRDDEVCDLDQLTNFLTDPANADKAEAWAEILGVGVDEIETYLDSLTPVRLRMDTRVTNHGFEDGEAVPFQSVLQAGTAVLVDDTGVPVVKCNCGNPLSPPEAGDAGADDLDEVAANPDDAWDGLDVEQIVVVEPSAEALEEVTIADLENGGLIERPVGSDGGEDLGTGQFQATLEWTSDADLDLHVTGPDGVEIYYGNTQPTDSSGWLDQDANVGCVPDDGPPRENVFWPEGEAPSGEYTVEVHGFTVDGCGGGDFTLTISVAGQDDVVETGSVSEDEWASFTVTVP